MKPIRLMQRAAPFSMSAFGKVKMMAAALATRSRNAGLGFRLALPGIELVGQVPAGAAERQLGRLRVGQIDQIGGGAAHRKAVNLAFQLSREVIAGIGPRRRCTGRDDERDQDRADYRAGHHEISNYLKSEPSRHEECTPRTVDLPILHDQ